jgi:hypothetical protein
LASIHLNNKEGKRMLKKLGDLNTYELAVLNDEGVEHLIEVEFMHRGIIPFDSPPIPLQMEAPTLGEPKSKVWKVSFGGAEVYFRTAEQAQSALELT